MKKKGFSGVEVLAYLILILFAGYILIVFTKGAVEDQSNLLPRIICKNSIATAASKGLPYFSRDACKPERVEINKADFKYDIEAGAVLEDEVKRTISDLMSLCWDMVGRGKLRPYPVFSQNSIQKVFDVWGCNYYEYDLICYTVTFEDINNFNGLYFWMVNHKSLLSKYSYFDFLYGNPSDELVEKQKNRNEYYRTNEEYAVVWKTFLKDNSNDVPDSVFEIVPTDIPDGKAEWSGVVFVPYSEVVPSDLPPEFSHKVMDSCIFVMN